jgi:hypothetical protein
MIDNKEPDMKSMLNWHSAFFDAIRAAKRLDFDRYTDVLQFVAEHQLTAASLQIDVLVIKKPPDAVIDTNIARIFKGHNIFEYKSPDDYVSVNDFNHVMGYAHIYASLNSVSITDISVSFVERAHPRELLAFFRDKLHWTVEERWSGIYIVSGGTVPIQIIESKKLSGDEYLWLKNLSNDLDGKTALRMLEEGLKKGKNAPSSAYIQAILEANLKRGHI